VLLRKHSKQSLSQPTIPEEEHEDQPEGPEPALSSSATAKPQVVKNLYTELTSSGGAVSKNSKPKSAVPSDPEPAKSPEVSGHESMERTVQRITKAIRGSGRSDSKSKKKEREASPSPSKKEASQKVSRKDSQKKNAQEKREIFKSLH